MTGRRMRLDYAASSDVGRVRKDNQDSGYAGPRLLAVCVGVGGAARGDIASSGDGWFVEDLGSTNGTYVGTARITQPTTLTLGTQVRIGKTILELRK